MSGIHELKNEDYKGPNWTQVKDEPADPYMKSGKGEHDFEHTSNRDFHEPVESDAPIPKDTEDFSNAEREAWLSKGTLPEVKKEGKAAAKEGAAKGITSEGSSGNGAQMDDPDASEFMPRYQNEDHFVSSFKERGAALGRDLQSRSDSSKVVEAAGKVGVSKGLTVFLSHELPKLKNSAAVFAELALHPEVVQQMDKDAGKLNFRECLTKARATLQELDKKHTVKRVSDSKAPPSEVGGKAASAADEEQAALIEGNKTGDFTRYHQIANARDIARKKRGY